MPELPDVEIIKNYIEAHATGKRIRDLKVRDNRILNNITEKELREILVGKIIKSFSRHGKQLFIFIDRNLYITMHFGMTGNVEIISDLKDIIRFERSSFFLSSGERIAFIDQRILGRIGLTSSPDEFIKTHKMGPDSLSVTWDEFFNAFHDQNTSIKASLMNQSKIAGLGNVYADEILFQAKIHPLDITDNLSEEKLRTLFTTMKQVLKTAIESGADRNRFPNIFLTKHREKNSVCPRCGGQITSVKINERSTYYCPHCQKS
jgi:formamidopyrimidine-DNA glycosylase